MIHAAKVSLKNVPCIVFFIDKRGSPDSPDYIVGFHPIHPIEENKKHQTVPHLMLSSF